ncbi:hypothetical protein CHGG_09847 [Chaetomium globosum CBS 148.51]|uniref:Myb-like domain-containing protein n=1 Tax=Chaetomium globosum (strain ATCC 6205 / CBS 148.51 / DSM 1962 / NBRC 6347 / NRRL 1970) TaxID=306901 RepID=Q2GQA7_CHAGB|nr:uncharacterized protein CHGG_09847 [Chaetomium globosum CBS 148.51]EAQ83443.1 hypothetical protein CHGG_09847 [Chaetomium globosum CBS 148.51]
MSYYQNPRQLSGFYGDLSTAGAGGMPMPGYDPYAVSAVPPLQMPQAGPAMGGPVGGPLPTQHRASSGAWNQEDDRTLLALRAMGKNWNQIQREAFQGKTGNACRKRHERLMERRGQNDFDNRKLERLCKEYMSMRKEIWQPLASRCGEKWNVVEMQCMSNGLKNIQSHARAYARRERLESGQPLTAYDDDGGLGCLTPVDDVDVADQSYSSPETGGSTTGAHSTPGGSSGSGGSGAFATMHPHQQHHPQAAAAAAGYQGYGGYGHHQQHHQQQAHHGHGYSNSVSSTGTAGGYGGAPQQASGSGSQGTSPYMGHGGRLPSVGDMGIDAIINRGQGS